MVCLIPALLFILAFYFACRLFWLRRSLRQAARSLKDISADLKENRVLKLPLPEQDLEYLLKAINENLQSIRLERLNYAKWEQELKEQVENISHDLRTPLTAIQGYLKMLDTSNMSEINLEYLNIAIRKSGTLQDLIAQFYDLSRITSSEFLLELEPLDAARILKETCLDHYALLEKEHLQFHMEVPETPVFLRGNAGALTRIFSNLLQNAVRYALHQLNICLKANAAAHTVQLHFSNDIDPLPRRSDPERLFDRFYMQEQSRGHGGTGLGLTISKFLTEYMNGTVTAEYTEKDAVTYFEITLTFPCCDSPTIE